MARNASSVRSASGFDASLLLIPGAALGAYALTRMPRPFLTGFALGAVVGWIMQTRQNGRAEDGSTRTGGQNVTRGREWLSAREPAESGTRSAEEKVDDMSEDSFPASDPPSYTATRMGKPKS